MRQLYGVLRGFKLTDIPFWGNQWPVMRGDTRGGRMFPYLRKKEQQLRELDGLKKCKTRAQMSRTTLVRLYRVCVCLHRLIRTSRGSPLAEEGPPRALEHHHLQAAPSLWVGRTRRSRKGGESGPILLIYPFNRLASVPRLRLGGSGGVPAVPPQSRLAPVRDARYFQRLVVPCCSSFMFDRGAGLANSKRFRRG